MNIRGAINHDQVYARLAVFVLRHATFTLKPGGNQTAQGQEEKVREHPGPRQ